MATADDEIRAVAERLTALRAELGGGYWQAGEVQALQARLKHLLGSYGAWGEDKPPMHQRARRAAAYESAYRKLLWPGHGDDGDG